VKSQGPRIYTAGLPLYPPNALPFYLSDLPAELRSELPQPQIPTAASESVSRNIAQGTDIVKLFTGSIVSSGHVVPMPLPIARAGAEAGHALRYLQVSMYSLMLLKSQPE
jgi:hypothetical protein